MDDIFLLHDKLLGMDSLIWSQIKQGCLQALEGLCIMSGDELSSELSRHPLTVAIHLIETVEESNLRRFKSFLIDNGPYAAHEVLILIL